MKIEKSYTYTLHQCFYVETQCGIKPKNVFSYMYVRITFIGRKKFLCFPAPTGRRLRPPRFLVYNQREDMSPQFSGSNKKEATTPYILWLQTPILAPPNFPKVEVPM